MLQRERPWLAFCIRYVWLDLTGPCLFDWPVVSMRGQCALCTGPRNDLHSGWTTDLYSRRHLAMGSGCTALIHPASRSFHIPRYSTILFAWWASVADDGPPFKQNCANISGYTHILSQRWSNVADDETPSIQHFAECLVLLETCWSSTRFRCRLDILCLTAENHLIWSCTRVDWTVYKIVRCQFTGMYAIDQIYTQMFNHRY